MEREERIRHQKEFLIKFAYWAVWGGLVLAAVKLIGPVLLPFIAAFFVAWILSFPVVFVTERMHIRRGIAAVAVVLLFYGLAGLLIGFLGNRIMLLGQELLGEVVRFVSETIFPMMKHFCAWTAGMSGETVGGEVLRTAGTESAEAVSRAGELLTGMSGTLLQQVSGIAVNIPGMCFKLLLAVISTVFMELDFPQIMRFLEKNIPEKWKETVLAVKKGTFGTMGKCAAAYVFIFLMTFAELAAGLLLLRIEGAFAIAFLIAVLDILPVLGTGTVLLPWAVIAFAGGNARMGIGVIGLYLIITVVRNIVEPKLVGKQMGLSPVVMLPCMIVGLHFFGILGLFGGNIIPTRPYTEDLLGLPVINIRYVPLSNTFNAFVKRCMDVVGSIVCIILFSPVMLLSAILVKATSKGPLIFTQERVGLHNKPFQMYKFRTMYVQTEEEEQKGWTKKNDPRVTGVGKFLRKTSLDEFPQLFNVLKGDMSLVGPRPERPQYVEKFREEIPRYMIKHQVRPGMTGWAQVNGYRGDTSIRKRIEHDLYYIENWTLGLDVKILFLTVFKGFINKNAY